MRLSRLFILIASVIGFLIPVALFASTGGIDATSHTARLCSNEDCSVYSIVNWKPTNGGGVSVSDTTLSGYIWSNKLGWINLAPINGGVHNTTSGTVSGDAWGSTASWVNFSPTHGGVTINPSTGEFSGYAWVSGGGWMLFDCTKTDACVKTDWRPTTVIVRTTPPPLICLDRTALNYGGSLPCVYPTLCTDTTATNYGSAGICTYALLCQDRTATNFGGSLPCTYTLTCTDRSATNYGSAGSCIYPRICTDTTATNYGATGVCTYALLCRDRTATNYGGALPCSYATTCTDTAATNYGATGACTYAPPPQCLDTTATNYLGSFPCTYASTICTDPTATNFRQSGTCVYPVVVHTETTGGGGGCPISTATDIVGEVIGQVKNSYCNTTQTVSSTYKKIKAILGTDTATKAEAVAATVGVVASAATSIFTALFLNPLSFSEIFLIPARLWSLLLAALGLRKRHQPWGTVYDSITKQPLDPAYVTLRTIEGEDVVSNLTDLDGRFGFVVPKPGVYSVFAQKTNYLFPSQQLVGRDHDELYRDLYFGEHFTVENAGDVVIKNIPMDPMHFDWNEFAKNQQNLMKFYSKRDKILRRVSDVLFGVGFAIAILATVFAPKPYNIIVLVLYVGLFFLRQYGKHSRPYGDITDAKTGLPLSFALIRIASISTGVEVMHRIADAQGRYYALLPNADYKIRIDRKMPDGTYQTAVTDMPATVKKGYLSSKFKV